jgi:hypothetical protein
VRRLSFSSYTRTRKAVLLEMVGDVKYLANWRRRQARIAGIAVLLAACLGAGLAAQADARRPPACITRLIIDRQEDSNGNDSPYLTVNTKFWEVDSLRQDVWHTVFRTVHVGDEVKAYEADWPDPDDRIDEDVVTGFSRGTLVFIGHGAKYRATYHRGAC